jgi:beta-galactosidase
VPVGENHFPFIPFGFDITKLISFSEPNYIVVRVSEQDKIMGHAYNCRDSWSGLYRDVEIYATGDYLFKQLWLYPDATSGQLGVNLDFEGDFSSPPGLRIKLAIRNSSTGDIILNEERKCKSRTDNFTLQLNSPLLWSPDSPNLYNCELELYHDEVLMDALIERIGFTYLDTKKNHFLINGEPYYMRGTGDFLNNPELGSGCPDTDRKRWRKKLRILRAYGYNYVRCQSYAPSPEYLDIADEVGLLVQSEMGILGSWAGTQQKKHVNKWPQPIA